jgi:hypothetical protein
MWRLARGIRVILVIDILYSLSTCAGQILLNGTLGRNSLMYLVIVIPNAVKSYLEYDLQPWINSRMYFMSVKF